jgi:hypothetical protein
MKLRTLAPLGLLLLTATALADTAVYDLDAKNAKEIAEAIRHVINAQCTSGPTPNPVTNTSMCSAELLPTGQLLVEAPASSQAQVATVLKAIAARNAAPTPRVTLQYWVIYGAPGKPAGADAALEPLGAVVQQLERAHSELAFSLLDTTSLTTQAGSSSGAHGGSLNIDQNLRASGDNLDLAARIEFAPRPLLPDLNVNLNVSVTVKKGEFVVLGERTAVEIHSSDQAKDLPIDIRQKPGMLFFVVHWQ